jgi:uncharacterized membrane protein
MLQYLIKTTDNTLASAIIISLLLFWIVRTADNGRKFPALMISLGIIAALTYAILKRNTGFAVREYYDLGVMLPSIVASLIFLSMVWKSFTLSLKSSKTIFRFVTSTLIGLALAYSLPSIFLSPFEFSVGMETIYNADFLYKVVGYFSALLIMFLIGLAVYRMSTKTPHNYLVIIVFVAVLIFLLQQSLEVVQILVGRSMVPRYPRLLRIVIVMLSHKNWFTYAYMILLTLWAVSLCIKIRLTSLTGANPAQVRLMKADRRSQLRYCGLVIACLAVSLITITALRSYANREEEISPPIEVIAIDGFVIIPLDQINDGNLHRFQFKASGGTAVRFIIIKKNESAYGVGLDACDICGPTGYYQRGDQVICKLCDVVINISTIGFPGGCNPVPLKFVVSDGKMKINTEDLEAEKKRFE